jgi:hypothetical protein
VVLRCCGYAARACAHSSRATTHPSCPLSLWIGIPGRLVCAGEYVCTGRVIIAGTFSGPHGDAALVGMRCVSPYRMGPGTSGVAVRVRQSSCPAPRSRIRPRRAPCCDTRRGVRVRVGQPGIVLRASEPLMAAGRAAARLIKSYSMINFLGEGFGVTAGAVRRQLLSPRGRDWCSRRACPG